MTENIKHDVNDCSPTVIDHFVGQQRVVNQITTALEAAWNDCTRLPHLLFTGGPGLGKTQLAHIIAREMGVELKEQLAQNLMTHEELRGFLLDTNDRDVLLIDEIHELPTYMQTALYRTMENGRIFWMSEISKKSSSIKLHNFTLIGATTDEFKLMKPLRDRFKISLSFDYYSCDELELLLRGRCRQLGWQVEENVYPLIASRGRGTPRIALRLLEAVRRTARAENSSVITFGHWQKTCELEGLDKLGLGIEERRYLRILSENNKPVRLGTIAMITGNCVHNISSVIEPYLFRLGLINKDNKGRTLTSKGMEYIRSQQNELS